MYIQRFEQYIQQEQLFGRQDKILVALSGGGDSVALLRLLLEGDYQCEAAHCNFHLRDQESDRDEAFVTQLCKDLNVPLHRVHFNTNDYARQQHVSIEMAARELRYQWFEEVRKEVGADVVAVAHHQDDSIETLLLNLIRGTGIQGLCGIRPKNGYIVRPLLCMSRTEILDYLRNIGQDFVTDSTNLQDEYTRNKIRLNLLPLMQEINPSIHDTLVETSCRLNDAALLYKKGIEEGKQRVYASNRISIPDLLKEAAPQSLLFEILHPLGFNSKQNREIFNALNGVAGKTFYSSKFQVVKDRDFLLIAPCDKEVVAPTLHYETCNYTTDFKILKRKDMAYFDADKLKEPLSVRRIATGDWFIPFGMKGKKKVSDFLTDLKYSRLQKDSQFVLCCGEDIIWVIGERTDNRYRIDAQTRRVTIVKL